MVLKQRQPFLEVLPKQKYKAPKRARRPSVGKQKPAVEKRQKTSTSIVEASLSGFGLVASRRQEWGSQSSKQGQLGSFTKGRICSQIDRHEQFVMNEYFIQKTLRFFLRFETYSYDIKVSDTMLTWYPASQFINICKQSRPETAKYSLTLVCYSNCVVSRVYTITAID